LLPVAFLQERGDTPPVVLFYFRSLKVKPSFLSDARNLEIALGSVQLTHLASVFFASFASAVRPAPSVLAGQAPLEPPRNPSLAAFAHQTSLA
jgi:hypothetical protein